MDSQQEKKKRLKVLCLHGYRQNAQIFRRKIGALRKTLKSRVDFEFISAPVVPNLPLLTNGNESATLANEEDGAGDNHDEQPRAWWLSNREWKTFSSREVTEVADGFEESMKCLMDLIKGQAPFDGFLGFSQGASFVHLLLASSKIPDGLRPRFVILFSGFKSLSTVHEPMVETKISLPSFHVCGITDEIVHHHRSEELAKQFHGAVVITHPGKHCIPPIKDFRDPLILFLDKFL